MANYYKFNFASGADSNRRVFKYAVQFSPDVPDNAKKIRNKILN